MLPDPDLSVRSMRRARKEGRSMRRPLVLFLLCVLVLGCFVGGCQSGRPETSALETRTFLLTSSEKLEVEAFLCDAIKIYKNAEKIRVLLDGGDSGNALESIKAWSIGGSSEISLAAICPGSLESTPYEKTGWIPRLEEIQKILAKPPTIRRQVKEVYEIFSSASTAIDLLKRVPKVGKLVKLLERPIDTATKKAKQADDKIEAFDRRVTRKPRERVEALIRQLKRISSLVKKVRDSARYNAYFVYSLKDVGCLDGELLSYVRKINRATSAMESSIDALRDHLDLNFRVALPAVPSISIPSIDLSALSNVRILGVPLKQLAKAIRSLLSSIKDVLDVVSFISGPLDDLIDELLDEIFSLVPNLPGLPLGSLQDLIDFPFDFNFSISFPTFHVDHWLKDIFAPLSKYQFEYDLFSMILPGVCQQSAEQKRQAIQLMNQRLHNDRNFFNTFYYMFKEVGGRPKMVAFDPLLRKEYPLRESNTNLDSHRAPLDSSSGLFLGGFLYFIDQFNSLLQINPFTGQSTKIEVKVDYGNYKGLSIYPVDLATWDGKLYLLADQDSLREPAIVIYNPVTTKSTAMALQCPASITMNGFGSEKTELKFLLTSLQYLSNPGNPRFSQVFTDFNVKFCSPWIRFPTTTDYLYDAFCDSTNSNVPEDQCGLAKEKDGNGLYVLSPAYRRGSISMVDGVIYTLASDTGFLFRIEPGTGKTSLVHYQSIGAGKSSTSQNVKVIRSMKVVDKKLYFLVEGDTTSYKTGRLDPLYTYPALETVLYRGEITKDPSTGDYSLSLQPLLQDSPTRFWKNARMLNVHRHLHILHQSSLGDKPWEMWKIDMLQKKAQLLDSLGSSGKVYAVFSLTGPSYSFQGKKLYRNNLDTGNQMLVGSIFGDTEAKTVSHHLFMKGWSYILDSGGSLHRVNLVDATKESVGSAIWPDAKQLVALDGTLFLLQRDGTISQVSMADGSIMHSGVYGKYLYDRYIKLHVDCATGDSCPDPSAYQALRALCTDVSFQKSCPLGKYCVDEKIQPCEAGKQCNRSVLRDGLDGENCQAGEAMLCVYAAVSPIANQVPVCTKVQKSGYDCDPTIGLHCEYSIKESCPAYQQCTDGVATACAQGRYCEAGLVLDCPVGHTCADGQKFPCAPGKYSDVSNATSCIACPDGKTSPAGATSLGACVDCPAGSYCVGGRQVVCPGNTFSTATGASSDTTCQACPVGVCCDRGHQPCPLDSFLYFVHSATLFQLNPNNQFQKRLGSVGEWEGTKAMTSLLGDLYIIRGSDLWRVTPGQAYAPVKLNSASWNGVIHGMVAMGDSLFVLMDDSLYKVGTDGTFALAGAQGAWSGTSLMTDVGGWLYIIKGSELFQIDPVQYTSQKVGTDQWTSPKSMLGMRGWLYIVEGDEIYKVDPKTGQRVHFSVTWRYTRKFGMVSREGKILVFTSSLYQLTDSKPDTCTAPDDKRSNWVRIGQYGVWPSLAASTALSPCPSGKLCEGGKVQDCPAGANCDCSSMTAGNYCEGGQQKACTQLSSTHYCEAGEKVLCPEHAYCHDGVRSACPVGYYCSAGQKIFCPTGEDCTGGTRKACADGSYCLGGAVAGSCSSLGHKYYCDAGVRKICYTSSWNYPSDYCDAGGQTPCSSLSSGYYCGYDSWTVSSGGWSNVSTTYRARIKVICPIGMKCSGGASFSCPTGSYCTGGNAYWCPPGRYCNNVYSMMCPGGTFSTGGATSCTSCGSGTFSFPGATSCSICPAGDYCPNGSRYTCPFGKTSTPGAQQYNECQ